MSVTKTIIKYISKVPNREQLGRETGVDSAALSRYVRGLKELTSAKHVDILAEHFGLQLVKKSKRKAKK